MAVTPLVQAAYRAHEAELVATGRLLPRQPMIFTLGRDASAFATSAGAVSPRPAPADPPVSAVDAAAHVQPSGLPFASGPPSGRALEGHPLCVRRDMGS